MFALFVMVIVIIGLLATVGYTIISYQNTLETASLTQRNAARMEVVAVLMRSASRPTVAGGVVRAPAGDVVPDDAPVSPGRMVVPASVVGDNKTPWGTWYGYCPAAIPDGAVVDSSTGTIDVNGDTIDIRRLAGRDYILDDPDLPGYAIDSGEPPPGVLGFVVASTPNRSVLPDCGEIVFRDGVFLIGRTDGDPVTAGGSVVPIMADASSLGVLPAEIEPAIYVAPTRQNEGTGLDAANAMSLSEAIEYWVSSRPQRLTLKLADGSYGLASSHSFAIANDGSTRFLRFVDSSPSSPSGATIVGDGVYLVFSSEISIEGVGFSDGVGIHALTGSRILLAASRVARVRVDGGDVNVRSDSSLDLGSAWGAASPLEISAGDLRISQAPGGGSLSIESVSGTEPAIRASGGRVSVMADIDAGGFASPWLLSGSSDLQIGQKAYSSGAPNVTYAGGTIPVSVTASATGDIDGDTASATCPALHPYPITGGCSAGSGILSASGATATGWECRWSAAATVPPIPLPADGEAAVVCGANPSR